MVFPRGRFLFHCSSQSTCSSLLFPHNATPQIKPTYSFSHDDDTSLRGSSGVRLGQSSIILTLLYHGKQHGVCSILHGYRVCVSYRPHQNDEYRRLVGRGDMHTKLACNWHHHPNMIIMLSPPKIAFL